MSLSSRGVASHMVCRACGIKFPKSEYQARALFRRTRDGTWEYVDGCLCPSCAGVEQGVISAEHAVVCGCDPPASAAEIYRAVNYIRLPAARHADAVSVHDGKVMWVPFWRGVEQPYETVAQCIAVIGQFRGRFRAMQV